MNNWRRHMNYSSGATSAYLIGAWLIDSGSTFNPWHPWWGLFVLSGSVFLLTERFLRKGPKS